MRLSPETFRELSGARTVGGGSSDILDFSIALVRPGSYSANGLTWKALVPMNYQTKHVLLSIRT